MTGLRVDLGSLHALGSDLAGVATELEGANGRSDRVSDAVGHGGLADAVRGFAHGWDDRREKIVAEVRTLGQMASGVADQLSALDGELAGALTDPAPQPATAPEMAAR